ncbi:MAG: YfiR family protein, partial [Planctomycetota bacterium]
DFPSCEIAAFADLSSGMILSVSAESNFTDEGGLVQFFKKDGKMRFQIRAAAAKKRGLKLSGHLLRLAKIVD